MLNFYTDNEAIFLHSLYPEPPIMVLPLFHSLVPAGFPSPAEDYLQGEIDLNKYLIRNPSSTFLARVVGDSMIGDHILPDDLLIVDRSVRPKNECVIVAYVDGGFTIKRLCLKGGRVVLEPANSMYLPLEVTPEMDFRVWGVKTGLVRR